MCLCFVPVATFPSASFTFFPSFPSLTMSKKTPGALMNPSVVNELIAGSVGGAVQVIVGQPLDTIKTRAQIAPRAYHYKE